MGLGKNIIAGSLATVLAMEAHALLACELDQAPRRPAELVRSSARPAVAPARVRLERRESFLAPVRSRRIILQ